MSGQEQRIVSEPARAGFGMSVDLWQDTLLVGSAVLGKEAPEAFVFKLRAGRWVQVARLEVPVSEPSRGLAHESYPVQVGLGAEVAAVRAGERVYFYQEREGVWERVGDTGAERQVWGLDVDGRSVALLISNGSGSGASWLEVWRLGVGGSVRREPIPLQLSPGRTATSVALRGGQVVVGAGCGHVGCEVGGEVVVAELDDRGAWREAQRWQSGAGPMALGWGVAWADEGVLVSAPFGMDDGQRVGWLGAWSLGRRGEAPKQTAWLAGRPGALGGPMMASTAPSLGAWARWGVVGLHFDREQPHRGGYALVQATPDGGWRVAETWRAPEEPHAGFSAAMGSGGMAVGSPRLDGKGAGAVWVRW